MLTDTFADLKDTRADLLLLSAKCADFESQIEAQATKNRFENLTLVPPFQSY